MNGAATELRYPLITLLSCLDQDPWSGLTCKRFDLAVLRCMVIEMSSAFKKHQPDPVDVSYSCDAHLMRSAKLVRLAVHLDGV